jgi:hypothetical protein
MRLRKRLLATTMLAGIAAGMHSIPQAAEAADLNVAPLYARTPWGAPGVDGVNTNWEAFGGGLNQRSFYGSRGSLSIPLTGPFGLQIDGSGGALQKRGYGSVAGHLFSRNPSQGLFGIYANYTKWDQFGGVHATHVAGEGEIYSGRWSLEGIVGAEFGNSASNAITAIDVLPPAIGAGGAITTTTLVQSYDVKTRFMDQVNLKYYFTDNWDGYVGHRYLGGKNALALGSEAGVKLGGGAMGTAFVEARVGGKSFEGVWGGLRFYFGQKDKTLIRRQREDDPRRWDDLFSIVNNFNQRTNQSSQGIPALSPPPEGDADCTGDGDGDGECF